MSKTFSFFTAVLFAFTAVSIQVQAQWTEQTSPTSVALFSVSVVDNSVAWIGGDQGTVLRTTDGGSNWTSVGGGTIGTTPVYNIFAIDAQTAICTGSATGTFIYRTTNGGSTWTQVYTNASGFMDAIWMNNSSNGFAYGDPVSGSWELYKTSDGGATWTAAPTLAQVGSEAGWNNAMYVTGTRIWFGTNNSRIYYSTDGGDSWVPQTTTQINSYSVWFDNAATGMMGGESALNQTTNGGNTWTLLSTLPNSGVIGALTSFNGLWWAARQLNMIFYSTDGGASWTTQYTAPTTGLYYAMSKSRNGNLIIATRSDGGISSYTIVVPVELTSFTANTNNLGQVVLNWQTATETNNRMFEIQRKTDNGDYTTVGFVNGAGTTTTPQSYTFVDKNVNQGNYTYRLKQIDFNGNFQYSTEVNVVVAGPMTFNLAQNFPNPFNPSTKIDFNVPEQSNVKLAVYNTIGQEVAILLNGAVTPGQHEVTFNANSLPSGAYFYKLQSGSNVLIKKMLLLK